MGRRLRRRSPRASRRSRGVTGEIARARPGVDRVPRLQDRLGPREIPARRAGAAPARCSTASRASCSTTIRRPRIRSRSIRSSSSPARRSRSATRSSRRCSSRPRPSASRPARPALDNRRRLGIAASISCTAPAPTASASNSAAPTSPATSARRSSTGRSRRARRRRDPLLLRRPLRGEQHLLPLRGPGRATAR